MDILDAYLFFVKQKGIIEDKDDAISQLYSAVEDKLGDEADGEDVKIHLAECKARWV